MSNTLTRIDVFFILVLTGVLVLVQELGWSEYFFKLPLVTLLVFYYIGKWARNVELRRAQRRTAG